MTVKKLLATVLTAALIAAMFSCSFNGNSPSADSENPSDTGSSDTNFNNAYSPGYPFADITVQDIESVTCTLGLKHRFELTESETEEFVLCVQKIEIGNKTTSSAVGLNYCFEIAKKDGTLITLTSGGIVTAINEVQYVCKNHSDHDYQELLKKVWQRYLDSES